MTLPIERKMDKETEPKAQGIDIEQELFDILRKEIQKEIIAGNGSSVSVNVLELPDPGTFCINRYPDWIQDGRPVYGVRGHGTTYHRFFNDWMRGRKPVYELDDFPWSYFTLSDRDQTELENDWSEYIYSL